MREACGTSAGLPQHPQFFPPKPRIRRPTRQEGGFHMLRVHCYSDWAVAAARPLRADALLPALLASPPVLSSGKLEIA